ncbi:MAG: hypothetical protein LUF33_05015 [Clostridiales bacterium]|nr:hypothetical protein [Clostridiales bacterium]
MKFSSSFRKKLGTGLISSGASTLICVLLFYFFGGYLVTGEAVEFEPQQTAAEISNGSIIIPGFQALAVSEGSTSVSANFYNPEENNCYFEISVILDDGDEEIYKSKYVSPGQTLYTIELNRGLEAGSYGATLHYSTYRTSDYTPLNGANIPITVVVT